MKLSFIFATIVVFVLFSCSSGKPDDIYPDSGNVSDNDSESPDGTVDDVSDPDEISDSSDETADSTDTDADEENDADSDEIQIITDPCTPNPCIMENSSGNCTVNGESYICGCNEDYFWADNDC
ncbi:MAG TPA: hypothetical protein PLZ43_14735, partial [bacterium]|nr:hypothetical protein [bacterium]